MLTDRLPAVLILQMLIAHAFVCSRDAIDASECAFAAWKQNASLETPRIPRILLSPILSYSLHFVPRHNKDNAQPDVPPPPPSDMPCPPYALSFPSPHSVDPTPHTHS